MTTTMRFVRRSQQRPEGPGVEPLADGQAIAMLGEHHWKDTGEGSGRRGIKATVYDATDGKLNVTVWLDDGAVTFANNQGGER